MRLEVGVMSDKAGAENRLTPSGAILDREDAARRRTERLELERRVIREMGPALLLLPAAKRRKALQEAMWRETAECRESWVLHAVAVDYIFGFSEEEMAERLGVNQAEVKRTLDFLHPRRGKVAGKKSVRRKVDSAEKNRKFGEMMARTTRMLEAFTARNSPAKADGQGGGGNGHVE